MRPLNPLLIYLSPTDIKWTINNAAQERKTDRPDIWNDWIDDVIAYGENSNYGKASNMTGLAGSLKFFKERQRLELDLIKELPIKSYVHEVQVGFKGSGLEEVIDLFYDVDQAEIQIARGNTVEHRLAKEQTLSKLRK